MFLRIRHHYSSLSAPQNAGTAAEQEASEDIEAVVVSMLIDKEGDAVNAVAQATER